MSHAANVPALAAVIVAILVVLGALVAFVGSLGLLRLDTFYDRVHAPTMGTTLGIGLTLLASMLLFSALESRIVLHELAIAAFVTVTTPVTFMLLVRAASRRDGAAEEDGSGDAAVPASRDTGTRHL